MNDFQVSLKWTFLNFSLTAFITTALQLQVNEAKQARDEKTLELLLKLIPATISSHNETCVYTAEKVSKAFKEYYEQQKEKPDVSVWGGFLVEWFVAGVVCSGWFIGG